MEGWTFSLDDREWDLQPVDPRLCARTQLPSFRSRHRGSSGDAVVRLPADSGLLAQRDRTLQERSRTICPVVSGRHYRGLGPLPGSCFDHTRPPLRLNSHLGAWYRPHTTARRAGEHRPSFTQQPEPVFPQGGAPLEHLHRDSDTRGWTKRTWNLYSPLGTLQLPAIEYPSCGVASACGNRLELLCRVVVDLIAKLLQSVNRTLDGFVRNGSSGKNILSETD